MNRRIALLIAAAALAALPFAASGRADTASVQSGGKLFQAQHCVMCHGMDGKGYPAIHTPDFTSKKWQAAHTDAVITDAITNGKKGTQMPAFGNKLSASQIQDLVQYIRSLGSGQKQ